MTCAISEDSDPPIHPSSLISVIKTSLGSKLPLYAEMVDAQADLSLCLAHMPLCSFCCDAAHSNLAIYIPFLLL